MATKKIYNHNGKALKYAGKNVRIPETSFEKVREFTIRKGFRLGWFYEQAALEKMESELSKEKIEKIKSK